MVTTTSAIVSGLWTASRAQASSNRTLRSASSSRSTSVGAPPRAMSPDGVTMKRWNMSSSASGSPRAQCTKHSGYMLASMYPECFVHCARGLPDAELDMFHRFIVTPSGDIARGGAPTEVDRELEAERKVLLLEACARDAVQSPDTIADVVV